MAVYRVFPLDFAGSIIGPGEDLIRDSDYEVRVLGNAVQAEGGYIEIWRNTTKIFPHTSPVLGSQGFTVGSQQRRAQQRDHGVG